MLDPSNIPEITPQETLTRYVISRSHFRKKSQTVKSDAFIPHPHTELSVTRLLKLSEEDIWSIGKEVALARNPPKTFYGRGDIQTVDVLKENLLVNAAPLPGNSNHADITNWPMDDKPKQKLIALKLASSACFVPYSSEHES